MSSVKEKKDTAKNQSRGTKLIKSEYGGSFKNIQGKQFGRLTAIHPTSERDPKRSVIWACLCECKTVVYISEDVLVHGATKSCGCLKKERNEKFHENLHLIDGTCVELIEKRKHRCDNTSGFRGVYKIRDDRWRVGIGFKGKRYHVGYFKNFEDAVAARLSAEKAIYLPFLQEYYASIGSNKYDDIELIPNISETFMKQIMEVFGKEFLTLLNRTQFINHFIGCSVEG